MFEILGITFGDVELLVVFLSLLGFVSVLTDFKERVLRRVPYVLSLAGTFLAGAYVAYFWENSGSSLLADAYTRVFALIYLISTFLILLAISSNLADVPRQGILHGLVLFSIVGMIVATATTNLIIIIAGWELASLTVYALLALKRDDRLALEAATKFFIIGAVGSGITLFGLSLIFGATGAVDLIRISSIIKGGSYNEALLNYGVTILIAGVGFKLAIVPFHVWIPDAAEGAPNTLAAFFLGVSKSMAFAVIIRIFYIGLAPISYLWTPIFALLAFITMTFGNLAALVQKKMKRMLAYSSIAHAGYIIMVLAVIGPTLAIVGAMFHIFMHAIMKIIAFIIALIVFESFGTDYIDDYAGMYRRSMFITVILALDMLALAGVPLFGGGGFWSKWFLFGGVIQGGVWWLGLAAALNSALSLYYYARVIKVMVLDEPKVEGEVKIKRTYMVSIVLATIILLYLGVYPTPFQRFLSAGAEVLQP